MGEPVGLTRFFPFAGCLRCLVYGQPAENEIRYLFWNELAQRFLEECVDLKDQEADYKD